MSNLIDHWRKHVSALFSQYKDRLRSPNFKFLFQNALWLFGDKIFRLGLNFLLTAYIARYLGVELFGVWNYVIAFVVLFSFFSTLGVYNQLLRDFVRHPERHNELLGSAFVIKLAGACITLALSFATIVLLHPGEVQLHQLVALVAIGYIIQSFDVIDFFFQSQLKAKWISISRFIAFVIFGLTKLQLVYSQKPLVYFIWAQLGELLLAALILVFFYHQFFGRIFQWQVKWAPLKAMLTESLPIFFAEIAILMYMRIDQVMLGEIIGNEVLGVYSAAVRLSELWYLIPGIICSTVFPTIIKAHASDALDYQKKLQNLYDFLTWLAIGIGIVVTILATHLVDIIYGEQFSASAEILVIHIWTSIFVFSGFASNQQLIVEHLAKLSFYRTAIGVIMNVILNLILIPSWGAKGAAVATLVAQAFSSVLSNYFFPQTRGIFWMNMASLNPVRIVKKYLKLSS